MKKEDGSENVLEISWTKILTKMAEEIAQAQRAQSMETVREHMAAIRVLCDLILQEKGEGNFTIEQTMPNSSVGERIDIGDDANGPSLFEF
jgi:hypothetical protein